MVNDELLVLINNVIVLWNEIGLEEMECRDYFNVEDVSLLWFLVDICGDEVMST